MTDSPQPPEGTPTGQVLVTLRGLVDDMTRRLGRYKVWLWLTVSGLVLQMVMSGILWSFQREQARQAAELRQVVEANKRTTDEGVCPLYALLLRLVNPARLATLPPGERQKALDTYAELHDQAVAVRCADVPRAPSPSDIPTPTPTR